MTNAPSPRADREAIARVIKDIARRWIYQTAHNGPDHLCGGIGNEAASAVLALGVLHPSREEEQGVPPEPAAIGAPSAPSETPAPSASVRTLADRLDALADNCAETAVKSRTESNAEYLLARASTYQECAGLIREALR